MEQEELIAKARAVRQFAYAPYSGNEVGAALLSADGRIFTGANVETAGYTNSICAESAALAAAVSAGAQQFTAMAVVSLSGGLTSMCGQCRQALAEFGNMDIILVDDSGRLQTIPLSDLLPQPVDAEALEE